MFGNILNKNDIPHCAMKKVRFEYLHKIFANDFRKACKPKNYLY